MVPTNKVLFSEKPDYLSPSFNNKNKQLHEIPWIGLFLEVEENDMVFTSIFLCTVLHLFFDNCTYSKRVCEGRG